MSKLKTNTIRHVDGSNDNITLDSSQNVTVEGNATVDGTSTLTGNVTCSGNLTVSGTSTISGYHPTTSRSNRNLIINGAMNVAQRGTSYGESGFGTVDRFAFYASGLNASVTTEQADVASGTTPYTLGFRKSHKITNGAQTGPDAGDYIYFSHKIEAQDMATSGWNYTSASSYITLSFWVKSSVAQNFYGYLKTSDGTSQNYPFETGSLSANTWTKITKTIPGHANLQFDMNTEMGVELVIAPFFGTDKTGTLSLNAWGAWSSSNRLPDNTSTWFTTNGGTFEYTGVQLEVGDVATDFEHRSYGDELVRCQRYYQRYTAGGNSYRYLCMGSMDNDGNVGQMIMFLHTPMRANISSMDTTGTAGDYGIRRDSTKACTSVPTLNATTPYSAYLVFTHTGTGWSTGDSLIAVLKDSTSYLGFSAEL